MTNDLSVALLQTLAEEILRRQSAKEAGLLQKAKDMVAYIEKNLQIALEAVVRSEGEASCSLKKSFAEVVNEEDGSCQLTSCVECDAADEDARSRNVRAGILKKRSKR